MAFGKHHRPGYSTYPQPGLFDDIYEQLARHHQVGWSSSEGTNLQLGSGPGQSGMTMETYLAKMFNHGATLVNIYSWGIGGEAMKTMDFRVVTEGEDALRAYRKFLKGEPLMEAKTEALTLMERLPPKIHQIQRELPAWIQKTASKKAVALMQQLDVQVKAKNFEEAEKTADSVLKLMAGDAPADAAPGPAVPREAVHQIVETLGTPFLAFHDKVQAELKLTVNQKTKLDQRLQDTVQETVHFFQKISAGSPEEREKELRDHKKKAQEHLSAFLNGILDEGQSRRLRQVMLQREGLLALGDQGVAREIGFTNRQGQQFVEVVRDLQRQVETLVKQAQTTGNSAEIRPKVMKIRKEHELKLEDLLTDEQKKQWREMLGKPLNLGD